MAIIDAGLKVEGRVPLKEFGAKGKDGSMKPGDEVEVYVERIENALGEAVLSREKHVVKKAGASSSRSSPMASASTASSSTGQGWLHRRSGRCSCIPSTFAGRHSSDPRRYPAYARPTAFEILKMDKRRGNIVVSRRTVLEESRAEQRSEIVQNLEEGQVVEGVVKNITDYGAFVDLGGIDGLLHVTDMAWRRVNHPSEILTIGQTVKVQIIRINQDTHRISLGMKQLENDPWDGIGAKYPIGKRSPVLSRTSPTTVHSSKSSGIEGLIHVSEMSWTKKNVHPGKILSTTQEVEVVVLEVDPVKRRISLGLKQTLDNPWTTFAQKYPQGTIVEGEVKNKTEFGLFIGLDGDVDGMVHLSDLDWNRPANRSSKSTTRVKSLRLSFSTLTLRRNASRSASSSFPATRSVKQQLRVICARTPL